MGSIRLGEINVMCRSIDSALGFYRDALGLQEVDREGDTVRLSDGVAFVLLLPFAQDPAPDAPYESISTISFDVLVDDVEATVRSLEAAGGARATSLGDDGGWAVADPDGSVIEVLPRTDQRT